jgi:putative ABC transport system permease protein
VSFVLQTLWYERARFLAAVLAVAFSALLIMMQCGLLLGLVAITSIPIDHSRADVWMGGPEVLSVELCRPIPDSYLFRLAEQPEVERAEIFLQGHAYWLRGGARPELCIVIGTRLEDDSLGAMRELTPELRGLLSEPGAVVIDESDMARLGVNGVGATAEVSGKRVRVVGLVTGVRSLASAYVLCSITTARQLLRLLPDQTVYVLGRLQPGGDAAAVVDRLRVYPTMSAFTAEEFSRRTQLYWVRRTQSGLAILFGAALGLLVGAVVTSQTLYAATVASLREYAVLRALGIPHWRLMAIVVTQSLCVGVAGVVLALPLAFGLRAAVQMLNLPIDLPAWLLGTSAAVTLIMSLLSGLAALRSLRLVEPMSLLR